MKKSIGLVGAFAAVVLTGCSGGDVPSLPDSNVSKFEFQTATGLYYFQSADHTIKCGIFTRGFPQGAGCQTYMTKVPDSIKECEPLGGNNAVGVQIVDGKAGEYCLAQGIWVGPAVEGLDVAGGRVLENGQVIDVEGTKCQSKDNVITCTKDDAGFMMSLKESKTY